MYVCTCVCVWDGWVGAYVLMHVFVCVFVLHVKHWAIFMNSIMYHLYKDIYILYTKDIRLFTES